MPLSDEPRYLDALPDGTVKQYNPITGAQVWTIPGRANRPLGLLRAESAPLAGPRGHDCAFCEARYRDTPPEKSRVVRDGWQRLYGLSADELFDTVAEFRCVANLFEILGFDYWQTNYGYELPASVEARRDAYLASRAGREHVLGVVDAKLRASGLSAAQAAALPEEERIAQASGFFGGGHDLIIARRHFTDAATDESHLASAAALSLEEHEQFIAYTAESTKKAYELNPHVRYVAVFQNWLRPAGASFDHLHKQLVSIDEPPTQYAVVRERLRVNPNFFNDAGPNYASRHGLLVAENEHAVAMAGYGHRYPTVEIYSTSSQADPWTHSAEAIRGMSDMIHAVHAATGSAVPSNEEWHYRPPGTAFPMPWRVMVKWRISTLAGFEGVTAIYLNTITPIALRNRVTEVLRELRMQGRIADSIRIGAEVRCRLNPLRYLEGSSA